MIWSGWEAAFLQAIGAQPTPQNVAFLDAWAQREEPYSSNPNAGYTYNPLNIGPEDFGSVGAGITAFANTITQNPAYADLLNALRGGTASPTTNYNGLALWSGGGGLAANGATLTGKGYSNLAGVTGTPSTTAATTNSSSPPSSSSGSASSTSSSTPTWLQNIGSLPFGLGPATEEIASAGIVGAFALGLLLIGGIWLIMGNSQSRSIVVGTAKTAAKAAAA